MRRFPQHGSQYQNNNRERHEHRHKGANVKILVDAHSGHENHTGDLSEQQ